MSVSVRGLSKSYGSSPAIQDVSFEVPRGSFTTLLGPSGAGKTSILRCIAGVETPDSGTIQIGDKTVFGHGVSVPPEQRDLGMVYQSYALWPHMSVFENVAYPLKVRKSNSSVEREVNEILRSLGIQELQRRYPNQLSGGEQQRVALARALVYRPEAVLLDEPFSNLDTPLRERLRDELRLLQHETGFTAVYVTHHRIEATSMSDQIVVLLRGRVSAIGTPMELLERPSNDHVASFLGGMIVVRGTLRKRTNGGLRVEAPEGNLDFPADAHGREGEKVGIYVKPQFVGLRMESDELGHLKGTVVGLTRETSNEVFYSVLVGAQRVRVRDVRIPGWSPRIGEGVRIEVPSEACIAAPNRSVDEIGS